MTPSCMPLLHPEEMYKSSRFSIVNQMYLGQDGSPFLDFNGNNDYDPEIFRRNHNYGQRLEAVLFEGAKLGPSQTLFQMSPVEDASLHTFHSYVSFMLYSATL